MRNIQQEEKYATTMKKKIKIGLINLVIITVSLVVGLWLIRNQERGPQVSVLKEEAGGCPRNSIDNVINSYWQNDNLIVEGCFFC